MLNLLASLRESDAPMRATIARFWGLNVNATPEELDEAMRQPENAARIWGKLDAEHRGALQALLATNGYIMQERMFTSLNGAIRKMGRGAIERENPLENPDSIAEALFYRGLIYEGFEQAKTGARTVIYTPADLVKALPTHDNTNYLESLASEVMAVSGFTLDPESASVQPIDADELENVISADTTIVDDMTTLLGYLRVNGGEIEAEMLAEADVIALRPHLIHDSMDRLTFIFKVGYSGGLIDVQDGSIYPNRANVRRWLEATRAVQLQTLVMAWMESTAYRDLWHIPDLYPEANGWAYNPTIARAALVDFLKSFTPSGEWWSIYEFIDVIKAVEPDFQRPNGDYNSWYIRNADGEYLNGFENWDTIEGTLLEFYLFSPLHWLGLADLSDDAARLNAYGRAFVNGGAWPNPPEPEDTISVQADGTLAISRRVSRIDRFQAMRFTEWLNPASNESPYLYQITMDSVRRAAAEQDINTDHITTFLRRMMGGGDVPPTLVNLLETWGRDTTQTVTLEEAIILRTTAPEMLDFILHEPSLRRYCGARLGDMAVMVRADQWEALIAALATHGIGVERR